jgi:hypothetical protein
MKLTALGVSCGRLGLCVAGVSVELDPAFLSARNSSEAASALKIVAEEFKILRDGYYVNVRPRADVLVRLLETHLGHELQQLQHPSASEQVLLVSTVVLDCKADWLPPRNWHRTLVSVSMMVLLSCCCGR